MTAAKYNTFPNQIEALGIDLIAPQNKAIVAQGVEMEFKSQKRCFQILKSIDLSIPKGNIQLLMGPSGSGKTTLLSILAGLMTPTRGKVCLLGEDITSMSRQKLTQFRQKNIGFIFQNFNLFPALTASENIEVALNIQGIRKDAKYQARLLLEQVGLENQAEQKPSDLSGGQKQRVAIARALAGSPQLIMADEPTAALDSKSGHSVITLLRSLAKEQGCTVLMVTHDPRIVDVADSVTYLEDGALKE
ncbi:MAG: ABC transporter ATP-binding protein [Chroococcus sp. CMT-3BRIN-NPC107]|jgi:putative ABC transport system ATP-binding protein|nr:ABC transporter ATP-binding protein [Chroococcus sp. CMT-3BRIN-NPC107]